jgi:hypothetical protein
MKKVLTIFLTAAMLTFPGYTITQRKAYFVIRAKSSLKYRKIYSGKVDKSTGVLCDQTGRLTSYYTAKDYPEKLRRVKYYDQDSNRTFVFLNNNMAVTPAQVAPLYKNRWQIECMDKLAIRHQLRSFRSTLRRRIVVAF